MRRRARRFRQARPRPVRSSASSPTRSRPPRRSMRCLAAIPISRRCRCTAWRWPTRASTTPRTCARPPAPTSTTRWMFRRRIPRSWRACGRQAPSSTRRRTSPSTTPAVATRAAMPRSNGRTSARAARGNHGEAPPAILTTPSASLAVRAAVPESPSQRTSRCARSAKPPAVPAAALRITKAWRWSCRPRA